MKFPLPRRERVRVRGKVEGRFVLCLVHPHLHPPPSKGEEGLEKFRMPRILLRGGSLWIRDTFEEETGDSRDEGPDQNDRRIS